MKVSDLMTTELFTVDRNDELTIADGIMNMKRVRHIPVVDEGRLVGILSQRDLFQAAISNLTGGSRANEKFLQTVATKEVMTEDVVTIGPAQNIEQAARLMLEHRIGCLPVVDRDQLVGVLTESDVLRSVAGQ